MPLRVEAGRTRGRGAALRQSAPRQHGQLLLIDHYHLPAAQPHRAGRAHAGGGEAGESSECGETKCCTAAHARMLKSCSACTGSFPHAVRLIHRTRAAPRTEHACAKSLRWADTNTLMRPVPKKLGCISVLGAVPQNLQAFSDSQAESFRFPSPRRE